MEIILNFPELKFECADVFMWEPENHVVTYDPKRIESERGKFMLLHEIGHARLDHYETADALLYRIEREAWDEARTLALRFGVKVDHLFISRKLRELRRLGY